MGHCSRRVCEKQFDLSAYLVISVQTLCLPALHQTCLLRTLSIPVRAFALLGLVVALGAFGTAPCIAQTKPDTTAPVAEEDFSAYGDADAPATSYCTQKVLYLSPTRLISAGYEAQGPFDLSMTGNADKGVPALTLDRRIRGVRGIRLQTNTPLISRSNLIVNLGASYWNSNVDMDAGSFDAESLSQIRTKGLRTAGLQTTVFKPLNNRHFLIVQAQADLSGTYRGFGDLNRNQLTYSGTVLFGWKPNDNLMYGFGVTRTYRAGQLLHIPVVMFNRTFNPHWGIEAILPARGMVRYNFSPTRMLLAGYEIEGNTFYVHGQDGEADLWLRRGELKPRLSYEQRLAGFVWVAVQTGVRYNYRLALHDSQNKRDDAVFSTKSGLPFYLNLCLNLVSP